MLGTTGNLLCYHIPADTDGWMYGWTEAHASFGASTTLVQRSSTGFVEAGAAQGCDPPGEMVGDLQRSSIECFGGAGQHIQPECAPGRGPVPASPGSSENRTVSPFSAGLDHAERYVLSEFRYGIDAIIRGERANHHRSCCRPAAHRLFTAGGRLLPGRHMGEYPPHRRRR